MQRYRFGDLWVPALAVVAMYAVTIGYQVVVSSLGIDFLLPHSTVPEQVTRDGLALAMAGVVGCIAAPIAEELFFRGLVVTGLLKWGFLPAAAVSAGLFTLAHLDIGSIIPFFAVGMVMAWLYYWRGCLWDSIAFHFLFNTTSFLLLVSQR
jgi:membrane protease YdiL (CAAX protease family)